MVCTLFLAAGLATATAIEYQGADAVLQQAMSTNTQPHAAAALSPAQQLRADLKTYAQESAGLAPAEAARQWLALVDRFTRLGSGPGLMFSSVGSSEPTLQLRELMEALPGPVAWPELEKQIEARPAGDKDDEARELGLRLLVHTLTGDAAKRTQDLKEVQALADKADATQSYLYVSFYQQLNRPLMATMDSPEAILHWLDRQMAIQQNQGNYQPSFQIPDLVAMMGETNVEIFLRRVLVKSACQLQVEGGTATEALARKLALELVSSLKAPQWGLVDSLDSVDLYEALDKRFPPAQAGGSLFSGILGSFSGGGEPDNYQRQTARIYYFLGLIAAGRLTNAVAVAAEFQKTDNLYIPDEVIRQMERAGFTLELNNFFHDLLRQHPELPFWDEYVQLAAHAQQTEAMVKLVQDTITRGDLGRKQREQLRATLCQALLADDQVEAGVKELQRLIETDTNPPAASPEGVFVSAAGNRVQTILGDFFQGRHKLIG